MAGHNKWSKIKHKKAATDAKKSSVYTKMAKIIDVAVKTGGGDDPNYNFQLKSAIDKAKAAGMPKSNIERAIASAAGKGDGDDIKEVVYEGYLPGGIAVMVFAATDNINRTIADVRTIFTKSGGSLGTAGSVAYLFEKKGVMKLKKPEPLDEEKVLEFAMDSGFDDVDFDQEDELWLLCDATNIEANSKTELNGFELVSAGTELIPETTIEVSNEDDVSNILKAMEALDDHDDVIDVVANFDLSS